MKTFPLSKLLGTLYTVFWLTTAQALAGAHPSNLEQRWASFMQAPVTIGSNSGFPYADCFQQAARKHRIPQALLLAVARGESNFDPEAVSHANAFGLMQILWPSTAHHLGITRQTALFDPCTNIDAGARYLNELLKKYQNNLHRTLAAYNYGPSRIPVRGGGIPDGAAWYSGYIYRHLDYIRNNAATGEGNLQQDSGEILIIRFSRPYRAAAFVNHLQPRLGDIRLDWFRRPQGGFDVVMLYDNRQQLKSGVRRLEKEGLRQPDTLPEGIRI